MSQTLPLPLEGLGPVEVAACASCEAVRPVRARWLRPNFGNDPPLGVPVCGPCASGLAPGIKARGGRCDYVGDGRI